ncbi:nuclear transport factor 2 family protein [Micromonospora sp. C32]|uniref:nuclear transport factor 2 family protein n=1 Tax=unclassified Micromonospora TaxID=2617518 RepID=UPI001B38FA06|nr:MULTISPECIES: nuclear transport factor 2 family protein [unclassified Micromonospora]MBQ1040972.1 nuclear transport factor 2 family protein [Micromonospora sp. C72]MBQ1055222.1 nuclear transport factor 2 family protein [Micromonospora sp. C32]
MSDPSRSLPAGPVELDALLAERAIERALLRYARGIDRMDRDLAASAFHPDARITLGGTVAERDATLDMVFALVARRTMTMHYLTNILVELDPADPDRARAETYGIALQRSTSEPPRGNIISGFRYVDLVTRRAGEWRVQERLTVSEWQRVDDLAGQWPIPEASLRGARDASDPISRPWPPGGPAAEAGPDPDSDPGRPHE